MSASSQKAKTHCPQGHPYDVNNTFSHHGGRGCKTCSRRQARSYRATHAKARETVRQWRHTHPNEHRDHQALRRARKAGATVERVYRSIVFKRDTGLCGECGITVDPNNWHLDHVVPLSKGGAHSYANTQVAHPVCNLRKATR